MEIAQYIADLVQSQREVGIAGLGTVYKKKTPGRYDAATHSFLPPSYNIAFKEEVAEQQSLSNRISLEQNLSREAADRAVAAFASDVQRQLSEQGQAILPPLGTLKRENGVLVIDVQQDFSAGLEFFGLPKVDGESLKAENQHVSEPDPIDQVEEVNQISEVPEVLDSAGIEPENLGEEIKDEPAEPIIPEPFIGAPVIEEAVYEETFDEEPSVEEQAPVALVVEEPVIAEQIQEEEIISETTVSEEEEVEEPVSDISEPAVVVVVDPVEEEIIIDNLLEEENPGNETHEPQLIEVPIPPKTNSIKYTIHEQPAPQKPDNLLLKVFVSLLVLVILAILAYMFYPKADEQPRQAPAVVLDTNETQADSVVKMESPKSAQDSAAKLDTVIKTAPEKVQQPVTETPPKKAPETTPKPATKAVADAATTYEVIGASVLNQKEADWFITQMKRNGITAKVVKDIPGKRLKMSIATLHNEADAKLERDRLEKKLNIKGIYIYRNQKK